MCPHQLQRSEHVGIELLEQCLPVGIQYRAHGTVTGVVDQQIQPPGLAAYALTAGSNLLGIVHVQGHGDGATGGQRRQTVGITGGGIDNITLVQTDLGQRLANATGTAGNQCDGVAHGVVLFIF